MIAAAKTLVDMVDERRWKDGTTSNRALDTSLANAAHWLHCARAKAKYATGKVPRDVAANEKATSAAAAQRAEAKDTH